MNLTRRSVLSLMGLGGTAGLAACARRRKTDKPKASDESSEEQLPEEPQIDLTEFEDLAIDMDAWSYDEAHDCYYQLALPYCLKPGSEQYEALSIFVPGPYFVGTKKGRSYSCTIDETAQVGTFTPATAPIAMPINAMECAAQECPATYAYEGLDRYLSKGIVYVYAGFRGRSGGYESATQEYFSGGVPWLVSDLKAAIRCLRYNAGVLPCDASRVFVFGQGGGGGMGALLGVSGDSELYTPYLEALGAATHDVEGNDLSDALFGQASWCPLGSFASADAAYEWMMGQYASADTRAEGTWTALLSTDLAEAYGKYVNSLSLTDGEGNPLTLDRIDDGSYTGGSYYRWLVNNIADSAQEFLGRTSFPYAKLPIETRERSFPGDPNLRATTQATTEEESTGEEAEELTETEEATEVQEAPQARSGVYQVEATVYDTLESYISSLNGDNRWLTYNAGTGEVDITGLWGFVSACREPSKGVCAYDLVDRSGVANQLFGTDEQPSLHFDPMVAQLVEAESGRYEKAEGWDDTVVAAWRGDLAELDVLDKSVTERVAMSDPMAFLLAKQDDEQAATVAPHWRINTGLFQSETTLAGEMNLIAALTGHEQVADIAYATVWEAGFELAERIGDPEDNLVAWIESCCADPVMVALESDDEEAAADEEATAETEDVEENS